MRTIAIANQKGGCGKTTTAINLSAALSALGKKVLVVDLDPQGHTTLGLGRTPDALNRTIYDVITNAEFSMSAAIINSCISGLCLSPSNILLSGAEYELAMMLGREYVLKDKLADLNGSHEICIIDCSPSLSLLTVNALVACDDVIIPVQTHYYAMEGLRQLLGTIDIVKKRFNQSINILGVLMTFVETRTTLSKQVEEKMRDYFGDLVFDTVIHKNVRLAEAPSAGQPVITYAPKSTGACEYAALAREICNGKN